METGGERSEFYINIPFGTTQKKSYCLQGHFAEHKLAPFMLKQMLHSH